ncbi:MAG TPA: hypothetical protein VF278_20450 [Pirellulales bacterium]
MGRLLTIALMAAAIGGVLGAVIGAALLATIAPLSEYSGWFIAVCAALTAAAAAPIAVLAMRGKRPNGADSRVRLAVALFGGAAGAAVAPTLFGDHPAGRQLLCVAGGALLAACLMGLVARIRGQATAEPRDGSPRRWFQFTLGSLLALTFLNYLGLSRTAITDAGLKHLEGVKHVGGFDFSQTEVTPAAVQRLELTWRRQRE